MIIFIGFKHVGKTTLGRAAAELMELPFTDLDELVESQHGISPREMVQKHGEAHFRSAETAALMEALKGEGILAVGGGTPIHNPEAFKGHTCVHIIADPNEVFGWISEKGRPAYYPEGDMREIFDARWAAQIPQYEALADHQIYNDNDYPKLAQKLKDLLS
jgi:shikimate kinase